MFALIFTESGELINTYHSYELAQYDESKFKGLARIIYID